MDKHTRIKIYKQAEELWGLVAQYDQAVEEMAELIVAINKYKRKCLYGEYENIAKIEENLIEEISDVKMCIEQLEDFMGEDKIDAAMEKKITKLQNEITEMKKRLKEGK